MGRKGVIGGTPGGFKSRKIACPVWQVHADQPLAGLGQDSLAGQANMACNSPDGVGDISIGGQHRFGSQFGGDVWIDQRRAGAQPDQRYVQ